MRVRTYVGTKRACVAMLLREPPVGEGVAAGGATKESTEADVRDDDDEAKTDRAPVETVPPDTAAAMGAESRPGERDNAYVTPVTRIDAKWEMFFIVRAINVRDRWSGQVGFPGGRQEKGETDLQTVEREVREEVGMHLGRDFDLVGRVHDRLVLQGADRLVVACYVYMQKRPTNVEVHLAPKEVAACGWCPVSFLLTEDAASAMTLRLADSLLATSYPRTVQAADAMGLSKVVFPKVLLPVVDVRVPPLSEWSSQVVVSRFILWGMTLAIVNDALHDMTRARPTPISLRSRSPSFPLVGKPEQVFGHPVHDVGVALVRFAHKRVTGKSLTWNEYVRYYLLGSVSLTGAAALLPLAALVGSRL